MSEDARNSSESGAQPEEKRGDARTPKTIRFSGPEWELVESAAIRRGMPAAEYVRMAALDAAEGKTAALDLARNKNNADSAAMPPGIVALIERIYRSTYIVATLKRDEMLREGRGDELDAMIKAARESQATILQDASK